MIIGLTGPAGSGKDTVADWLEVRHGFSRIALADPIRKGLCAMFDLPMHVFKPGIKEQIIPSIGKSPRELMQTLGTEWGRDMVARDIWLRMASRKIAAALPRIVVTDIRKEDEAQWLRGYGGGIWRIHRSTRKAVRPHTSESGAISISPDDLAIPNDGSIDDLFSVIDDVLDGIPPF